MQLLLFSTCIKHISSLLLFNVFVQNNYSGKKGKTTPLPDTEPVVALPMKKPTGMLKRGQEDVSAKCSCKYSNPELKVV